MKLYAHQEEAINKLKNGSILVGGVGSGKSLTALYYYITKEREVCPNLYIITTARKRDTKEWITECIIHSLDIDNITIDSWNNIGKYIGVQNAFFIFDEQRVIGSGAWVKSFLTITKHNRWILLSATPGDVWEDYIPVFIANGFYKNRTGFLKEHAVFSRFSRYPKIEKYIGTASLEKIRSSIVVHMKYERNIQHHDNYVDIPFDKQKFDIVAVRKWNPYDNEPIRDASGACYLMRRIVNSDPRRIDMVTILLQTHSKIVLFYNFNYERDLLLELESTIGITVKEWSGHKHEPIPDTNKWLYIVQYTAGAEGWNCIETDTIIFYSLNYSYKLMIQAAGRIDRLNTPYSDLHYYYFVSRSKIDILIQKALKNKKNFNEALLYKKWFDKTQ